MTTNPQRSGENGTALLVLLLLLLPLAMVFGSLAMTNHGRSNRFVDEVVRERCFWAAEAGIDDAVHRAGAGLMPPGIPVVIDLGGGMGFEVMPVHIGSDGLDNDRDEDIDEPDEDLLEVHSVGRYRGIEREIVTWLGRTLFLPPLNAAITITDPNTDIDLRGAAGLNGNNHDLGGRLADPSLSQFGISIMPPGGVPDLSAHLTGREPDLVSGVGGSPSLGISPLFDPELLAGIARNVASLVLTNSSYSSYSFGSAAANTGFITYREGDVRFSGSSQGAGILVVTGNLVVTGRFRFDGLVIVLGNLEAGAGTTEIFGALVMGPRAGVVRAVGTLDVRYSAEALQFANTLAGRYSAFNGWQELAR